MVEVGLFADHVGAIQHEDQRGLDLRALSGGRNPGPDPVLGASEPALDGHCIARVMQCFSLHIEIRERSKHGAHQALHRVRAVGDGRDGGNLIPGVAKRSEYSGDIVVY